MRFCLAILATAWVGCSSATVGSEGGDAGAGNSAGKGGAASGGTSTSTSGGASASAGYGGSAGDSAGGSGTAGASGGGGKMGSGGIVGAGGTTSGSCGSIPAPGTWDAASISPVASPPGIPGYQFTGKSVSVVVDPFDTAKVWLGTGEYGLYQSTDCGASWVHVSTGTDSDQIDRSTLWSMAVDPVNQGTIYTVAAYGAGSVWKSTNGGLDWVDLFPSQTGFQYNFANNISMDAHDPLHLVTMSHGSCDDFSNGCLTETFDGGETWPNRVSLPKPWGERGGVDVVDATTWILGYGGDGMYVTTDNGQTWTQAIEKGAGDASGEFSTLPLAPAADGAYYVDSFQGALRSTDGVNWSLVWAKKDGISARLEALITTPTTIYAGDYADIYSAPLSDYGNWTKITGPALENFFNTFMAYDSVHKIVYVSGWEGGMVRYVEP
ncbi:MAG TPA: hypothetical protein VGP93_08605 [Polyangiaceae bacterium]|nr:hypothetical protein [Polyangiaceae bacterium]